MRQNWRELLFLHWAFASELIRPLIPPALELDLFEGMAYVGLVSFTMTGVRPTGLPAIAGLSSFHETNVRTYVHIYGRDPGVWFFSLDAANTIAVRLARGLFHLPYHRARMFLEREHTGPSDQPSPILLGWLSGEVSSAVGSRSGLFSNRCGCAIYAETSRVCLIALLK